jgi:hypothetical protein
MEVIMSTTLPKPSKVYFQPWIGSRYGSPLEIKLLILGESHYGPKTLRPDFTIALTREYANYDWNHRFWTNIMQAVDGRRHWEINQLPPAERVV